MADDVTSAGPRGTEPPERMTALARLRGHPIDLTPLRRSRDFRLLFAGLAVSPFGSEITPPPGLEAIREGLRFLRGKRVLQMTYLVDFNAMVCGMPLALFPAVADRLGVGPSGLGLLYAAGAAGSLLASLFSGHLPHVRGQGHPGGGIGAGRGDRGFGLSTSLWAAIGFLAAAHVGDMVSGVHRSAIAQTVVSDELRGRLDGIGLTVWTSGPRSGTSRRARSPRSFRCRSRW